MKTTLTVLTLLAGAVSVYADGYISMNDYNGGYGRIQVFQAQTAGASTLVSVNGFAGYEEMGQSANTYLFTPGFSVYASTPSTIGSGYDVGLLALDGGGATSYDQLSLVANSVVSSWMLPEEYSTVDNNYGMWNTSAVADIPGNSPVASIAVAVWQNNGVDGMANTLFAAQQYGYNWGVSGIETASVATNSGSSTLLPATLTSFSLASDVVATPEPNTFFLGLAGLSAFLLRKKHRNGTPAISRIAVNR